jgi:4-amino-4-deoxy-L-arabinose transferase-like glycosyltransferase
MVTAELLDMAGPQDPPPRLQVHRSPRHCVEVVVPVYNEERCLEASILRLRRYLDGTFPFDALVTIADNASIDSTAAIGRRLADQVPGVKYLHLEQKGRGRALRTAWSASQAQVVAYMDVDLSTGLEALLPLVAPLLSGHSDVAIGTRLAHWSRVERGPKREVISRTYNKLLHTAMRSHFSDAQCGFKAVRADVARRLLPLIEDEAWFFDTELLLLAEHNGLRIHEVPVDWIDDPDSKVHIVATATADLKGMLRMKRQFSRPRYDANTLVVAAIVVLASVLYTWELGRVGWGNSYYAAAVKSATVSWKAFFFGSLDPGSFITVDKPPAALWVQALSARIFGFNTWSILLPEAIAGVASVLILHRLVRKWAGDMAAHLAAIGLALTPVAVVMFRYNNPDAFLTFLCLAAAWALWSAIETGRLRGLLLSFGLLGLAFDTKMLQAMIVLPAFGLAYLLFGPRKLGRRVAALAGGVAVLAVSAGWWVVIVALWPADARPYIGSTTDNSIISLIFGYNGLSRIFGNGGAGGGGGPSFAGDPSWLRMFNPLVGGQISWLMPLAGAGLIAGVIVALRRPRQRLVSAGWILWGGWAIVMLAVFSRAEGIFHPYYTIQAAPAVAALAGAGAVTMWKLGKQDRRLAFALPTAVAVTGIWAIMLLGRTPGYDTWLTPVLIAATVAACAALFVGLAGRRRTIALGGACAASLAVLAGPTAYSLTSITNPTSGALASAGPTIVSAQSGSPTAGGGPGAISGGTLSPVGGGAGFPPAGGGGRTSALGAPPNSGAGTPGGGGSARPGGSATVSSALVSYLETHRGSAEYIVAAFTSSESDSIIIQSGEPVVTIGGFNGSDPTPTLAQFEKLVESGKLRYVVMTAAGAVGPGGQGGQGGPGGPGGQGGAAEETMSEISQWVDEHGHSVTVPGASGVNLYEVGATS